MTAAKKPAEKPLPCPFCGCKPTHEVSLFMTYDLIRCRSKRCEILPSTDWFDTPEQAIAAWNRRAK